MAVRKLKSFQKSKALKGKIYKRTKDAIPKGNETEKITSIFKNESEFIREWMKDLKSGYQDDYDIVLEWTKEGEWENVKNNIINTYNMVLYIFDQIFQNPDKVEDIEKLYGGEYSDYIARYKGEEIVISLYVYEALKQLQEDWIFYKKKYPALFDENKILVFRSIAKSDVKDIVFQNLNPYWSWHKQSAEAHWGMGGHKYIVVGLVDKDKIDWKDTILRNMNPTMGEIGGEPEREIYLKDGTPIIMLDVLRETDRKTYSSKDGDGIPIIEKLKEKGISLPYLESKTN